MRLEAIYGVLPLPTGATKVLEAFEVSAEIGPDHSTAHGAERVLKVRIDLNLWARESGGKR